jgi:hypothetical protein
MKPLAEVAVGTLCLLCIPSLHAQSAGNDTSASPLPAIIKAFNGHWKLSVKFEAASGLPPGTSGRGEEVWRTVVDGKTLLSEESWKAGPANMSLLGIIWWDGKENRLHAMDCNNQGRSVCGAKDAADAVQVKWTGTELTIEEPEKGADGKVVTSRVTFKDIQADSFTETDAIEAAPGRFETVTTLLATRVH